jgi:pSer/pThr/pTyr-binding forkhead associated (FHA) protein
VRTRIPFLRSRDTAIDLVVVEGRDAGQQFTVDSERVRIGRGVPTTGRTEAILLSEPSVSSFQALIHVTGDGAVIEHREGATNPTLVNGREIHAGQRLAPGDRIQMGHAVLEVRSRQGAALGDLTEAFTEQRPNPVYQPADETTEARLVNPAEATERRLPGRSWGRLVVERGVPGIEARSFELKGEKVRIGRSPDCDVEIPERGVSRTHAVLCWEGERLVLHHRSATNPTYLNGLPLESPQALRGGEQIQLADRVVLRLELLPREPAADPNATVASPRGQAQPSPEVANPGLITAVHEQIQLRARIEEEFGFTGAFLDIDVVDSYGMKARATRPDCIIVSFDRFREFARSVVEEYDGQVLNSNGDELMCFFESPHQAVRAGSALLVRLEEFNEKQNLLETPFRVRQGVHSGDALVDRRRGVAYSPVLDVAGHLQKMAAHDGLLISEQTLEALPEGLPFEEDGILEREGIRTFRMARPLE